MKAEADGSMGEHEVKGNEYNTTSECHRQPR